MSLDRVPIPQNPFLFVFESRIRSDVRLKWFVSVYNEDLRQFRSVEIPNDHRFRSGESMGVVRLT